MDRALLTEEPTRRLVWCLAPGWFQPSMPGILDRLAARAGDAETVKPR
ncbi:MAG: hypothetical protein KIS66_11135 [Fimbriimonadaceae bacterium]|nr:hypothetical protein [Fimbriimonadaceae bacterium]